MRINNNVKLITRSDNRISPNDTKFNGNNAWNTFVFCDFCLITLYRVYRNVYLEETMKKILGSLLFGSFLLASTASDAAQAIATAKINFREGPGTNYALRGTIEAGQAVEVQSCRGSWCQISYNVRTGWAAARYLAFSTSEVLYNTYKSPSEILKSSASGTKDNTAQTTKAKPKATAPVKKTTKTTAKTNSGSAPVYADYPEEPSYPTTQTYPTYSQSTIVSGGGYYYDDDYDDSRRYRQYRDRSPRWDGHNRPPPRGWSDDRRDRWDSNRRDRWDNDRRDRWDDDRNRRSDKHDRKKHSKPEQQMPSPPTRPEPQHKNEPQHRPQQEMPSPPVQSEAPARHEREAPPQPVRHEPEPRHEAPMPSPGDMPSPSEQHVSAPQPAPEPRHEPEQHHEPEPRHEAEMPSPGDMPSPSAPSNSNNDGGDSGMPSPGDMPSPGGN